VQIVQKHTVKRLKTINYNIRVQSISTVSASHVTSLFKCLSSVSVTTPPFSFIFFFFFFLSVVNKGPQELATNLRISSLKTTITYSVTHRPLSGMTFLRNFTSLLILKTYHSHPSDLTHISSSFSSSPLTIHYPCSFLLQAQNSSFPQIFFVVLSTFSFTGLTPCTPAVFLCSRACCVYLV